MKPLSLFYFAQSPDDTGTDTVIIQTAPPHYVGRIIFYKSLAQMTTAINNASHLAYAVVPGYNIAVVYAGTIKGTRLEISPNTLTEMDAAMKSMAGFFLGFKIAEKRGYYDKPYSSDKN